MDRFNGVNLSSTGLWVDRQPEYDNSASAVRAGKMASSGEPPSARHCPARRKPRATASFNHKPATEEGSSRFSAE
jgi:hypothetical protein